MPNVSLLLTENSSAVPIVRVRLWKLAIRNCAERNEC